MKFLTINGKLQRDSSGRLITIPDNYDNSAITLNGKLLKTGGGLIGSNIIKRQLSTPSISLVSGTTIQINSIDSNATTIAVYADSTKIGEVAKEGIIMANQQIDVSKLTGWSSLASGNHNITIITTASGYLDSAASNAVTVNKASNGYKLTLTQTGDLTGSANIVYANGTSAEVYTEGVYNNVVTVSDVSISGYYSSYGLKDSSGNYHDAPYTLTSDTTLEIHDISCIIEGTQITLADGTAKAIEDITYDDELLVWNFYESKFDSAKPAWIKVEEVMPRYNLVKFSNGVEVGFAGPGGDIGYHRVFNKEAKAFTHTGVKDTPNGTTTFAQDGTFPTVVSQEVVEKEVKFYNVITDKHYNLFANGILTSCRLSNKYHIENIKYVGEKLINDEQEKAYFERIESKRK